MSPSATFGWPFRQRARAWLSSLPRQAGQSRPRAFQVGSERVVFLETARIASGQTVADSLVVRGDLSCGPGCTFLGPVYVAGNCEIGKRSRLRSIEADGFLQLGSGIEVGEYAAGAGEVELRPGCTVGGQVWAETSLRFGLECSARSVRAANVATQLVSETSPRASLKPGVRAITLPAQGESLVAAVLLAAGIRPQRLRIDRQGRWFHEGDLHLTAPVVLRSAITVNGSFSCEPGTLLQAPVQARGSIVLGEASVVQGALTAGADLTLGRGSVFQGDLWCGQMMRLNAGVRGVRRDGLLSAWSNGELSLEEDVVVRGEIASGFRVSAVAAAHLDAQVPNTRGVGPREASESQRSPVASSRYSSGWGNRRAG